MDTIPFPGGESSFDVSSPGSALNVSAEAARGPTFRELKTSAVNAYRTASIPAQEIGEGYRAIASLLPEEGKTRFTPLNVAIGLPRTVAEIGAEFVEGSYKPESLALMRAGRILRPLAESPVGQKVIGKAGELTTKHLPTFKKILTYRFGVDGKFIDMDDARIRSISSALEKATELGKQLSDDLSIPMQKRLGQILRGGVSVSERESGLRSLAGNARGFLDDLEKKAMDLDLIPKNALGRFTRRDLAGLRKQQKALTDEADALEVMGPRHPYSPKQPKVDPKVRELRAKAQGIQKQIADFYRTSGQKYVPRLYRVFENPSKHGIENAALPFIDEMAEGQLRAMGGLTPEAAESVVKSAQKAGKAQAVVSGSSKVKIGGERFRKRVVDSDAYRRALGEIIEPAYPVAKGVAQVGRDIANAQFFKDIAKNTDWVSAAAKPGYKLVVNDKKKYGALAGQYLKQDLANDLEHVFKVKHPVVKIYDDLLSKWKFGKVVLNPSTHARNIMSNSFMLDQSGMGFLEQPRFLQKAATDLLKKGRYFQEAKEQTNLLGNEFFGGEIKAFRDALFSTGDEGLLDRAVNWTRRMANKAGEIYQGEEQVFKMAKYIHAREQGLGVKEAAAEAEKWLFNYTKVSPLVDTLRRMPLGAPFITYFSKAAPRIMENAVKDPMKLYKYDLLFDAVEEVSKEKTGLSDKDFDTIKRTYRGQGLVLPFKDENGDALVMDLTYILPWGDIAEQGSLAGIPGGPVKTLLEVYPFNKSTFKASKTNAGEIYTATDNDREKAMKITDYVLKNFLPSWTPGLPTDSSWFKGGYSFEKFAHAVDTDNKLLNKMGIQKRPDYFNRVRNLGLVALDTLAGIKISPVNAGEKRAFENLDKKRLIQQLKMNTGRVIRHPGVSQEYKKKIMAELGDKIKEILAVPEK